MEIEIRIDEKQKDLKVIIINDKMDEKVTELVRRFSEVQSGKLLGYTDQKLILLDPSSIERVFTENEKVYAGDGTEKFLLKMRLYEVEEKLANTSFVRVSNTEIVNFDKVKNLDLSFTGSIGILLKSGSRSFVSRRYMLKIKEYLGL